MVATRRSERSKSQNAEITEREVKMKFGICLLTAVLSLCMACLAYAAYPHHGEGDSGVFLTAYPDKAGTKLDSCAVCHTGGSYVSSGKTVTLGSCQWCHYKH